ncbi:MAG: PAS domain S-box protein [Desulfovibrio sp.]|nr:MAG: PAS domain S-box protein [Desulfovibrio sp.]
MAILASPAGAQGEGDGLNVTRALFISSYHPGLKWSDDIERGIRDGLHDISTLDLMVEYMDTKRFSTEEHLVALRDEFLRKYSSMDLDVVLTADDHALRFVREARAELFPETPIVFCGANFITEDDLKGDEGIIGVTETIDIQGGIDVALRLHPETRRVYVVMDRTVTGQIVREALDSLEGHFPDAVELVVLDNLTLDELVREVSGLTRGSLVYYVFFYQDRNGVYHDSDAVVEHLAEAAHVPVYCAWDVILGRGVVGGLLTSGYFQGLEAGRLAKEIIHGRDISTMPRVVESPNHYMFDYGPLVSAGVDPRDLPQGRIVVNQPESFYQLYKSEIWIAVAAFVFMSVLIVVMGFNILLRRRAQRELFNALEELQSIFDSSQVGIMLLEDRRVRKVNQRLLDIFGYKTSEEILGSSARLLHATPESFHYFGELNYGRLSQGERVALEYQFVRKDGVPVWVTLSGSAIDSSSEPDMGKGVVWMIQDITARKQAQDELAALNLKLEGIVEERTAELRRKAEELESAYLRLQDIDNIKTAFLNTVSHDLRTPLTSILGFAKLIHKDFTTAFAGEGEKSQRREKISHRILDNLEIITFEGERLTRLINDFLDLSRIETGKMEWRDQDFALSEFFSKAITSVKGEIQQNQALSVQVQVSDEPLMVHADPDRIMQVLVNLLTNAAKFTSQGEIVLSAERNETFVEVRVADTGTGISDYNSEKVFDKFYQITPDDTLMHTKKGSGLGLAICREIITHYHGRIWVEPNEPRGSVFVFTLPVVQT